MTVWAIQLSSTDDLETRSDIDRKRIGYIGTSWRGTKRTILPAFEDCVRASGIVLAGLGVMER